MNTAQIQAYLRRRGSPMAGEIPQMARVAQRYGVPLQYVLGIAGAESEFGTTGYARGRHNPYGYGIHSGLDYPTYTAATQAMLKGITSKTYRGQQTIQGIAGIYAPSSENDTVRYGQNVARIANIFGGNYTPGSDVIGAADQSVAMPDSMSAPTDPSSPGGTDATGMNPMVQKLMLLSGIRQMRNPQTRMAGIQSILTAKNPAGTPAADNTAASRGSDDAGSQTLPPVNPTSSNWFGSKPLALAVAEASGLPITSEKRQRKYTASGGISDHWVGSTHSYATDLGTSGSAGDRAYRKVMDYLADRYNQPALARTNSGAWRNFNLGGYRYQVGWRVPGHYDHIHVGVEQR